MSPHAYLSRPGARYLSASLLAMLMTSAGLAQQAKPAAAAANDQQDDTIVLSPFTVDASKDKGYYAENTLAGSRMRTNISDLGASISVITKQQMDDTASVDINDVFRYEINTEGSSTYTPSILSLRSDGIVDTNAGYTAGGTGTPQTNATSNRVRGLGVPSMAINYYPAISQVPMDSYNIQSLEISRGPNSMLFGMGSPAGIVNQTPAQALLKTDRAEVNLRMDDRGSFRNSLAFNKVLIRNKLAIYGAVLYDDRHFQRKPSYDRTHRQYGTFTYKPFKKTTIRASIEHYSNENRRPNTLTPRDFVTQWNLAGQPIYDPLTKKITLTKTGQVIGPYILNSSSPYASQVISYIKSRPDFDPTKWNASKNTYNGVSIFGEAALTNTSSILYVPGIAWTVQSRTQMEFDNSNLVEWFQPLGNQQYRTIWGTPGNPTASAPLYPSLTNVWANSTWADMMNRYYAASAGWTNNGTNVGGYKYPGVTDRSIYDWKNININQMNFGTERNTTANVELEQEILPNLDFSAGWFRQDFTSVSNYTVSQLNVATLFVDTTKYLPDGTPNPYVGKPYVEAQDPDQFVNTEKDDHYRAMLAYTPDFTQHSGWLKWLGHHQILGLWSRQEQMKAELRKRLEYIGSTSADGMYRYMANESKNLDGTPTGWNFQTTSLRQTYYLASPGDPNGVVTHSPGEWNAMQYQGNIQVYDYANSQFKDVTMNTTFNTFDASTGRNQRIIDSLSAGMTNYFWKDRLITTFGIRRDDYKARATTNGTIVDDAGTVISPAMTNAQKWVNGLYQTETVFNRWNRWDRLSGNTKTIGAVFKPFRNWTGIENRANAGSLAWQFVRDFGLSYNKSDNFNAPDSAQVDAFGKPLPKPTGTGKDYGFQFQLFDNKLFARVTWFDANNENERTNPGSSISRLTGNVDTTLFRNWARTIAMINMGMDPTASGFGQNLSSTEEAAVEAAAEKIWGMPYNYYTNVGNIYATRSAQAKGVEAQITYNPIPNWTMKFTAGKQTTVYSNVLKEFNAWYAYRSPTWNNAKAADYLLPQYQHFVTYTTSGGRPVDLTSFWKSYGYDSNITLDSVYGYYNAQLYYDGVVTPQYMLARDLEGQAAPGQRRYRWSFLTNYAFVGQHLKGFSVGGSERWEDKAVIGYLGKSSGANTNPAYMDISDTTKPVYDKANWYTDLWVAYTRRILQNKVKMKIQLNVSNVFEPGGLRVVSVNYDGSPYAYRIIDSRQYVLSASFEF